MSKEAIVLDDDTSTAPHEDTLDDSSILIEDYEESQLNAITYSMSSDSDHCVKQNEENRFGTPKDPYDLYCFSPVRTQPLQSSTRQNYNLSATTSCGGTGDTRHKRERVSTRSKSLSPGLLFSHAKRAKSDPSPRIDGSGRNLLSPRPETYPPRAVESHASNYQVNDIAAGMLGSGPLGSYSQPTYQSSHHNNHHIMSSSSFPPQKTSNPHYGSSSSSQSMTLKLLSNHSSAWNDRFKELLSYKREHGDCLVPQRFPQNPQLGVWVNKQRAEYKLLREGKKSSMTQERISALESVGFVWAKRRKGQPTWDLKFEELKRYRAENGDCLVPTKYAENPALGRWVSTQRAQYKLMQEGKPTTMTEDRVHMLENLGFVWRLQF